ncbi:MAG TPA: DEAD/DEAH box helicase [Mycobacteriales bacterium]|nr:DEAD/DEAH box helicase [Mycobacteriales bacterium]
MASTTGSGASTAFDQLAVHVRRWVYDEAWTGLRDAQEAAIPLILGGRHDVLISAATAGGKTEAAFLPIVSALLDTPQAGGGIHVLYVAPLKALINDQYQRLSKMCDGTDVEVHRWHGDVAADRKHKVLQNPGGILLITPESLEAMFVLRGTKIPGLFASLRYIVIDELHAFLGTERGAQLLSQLHRLELVARRRVVRVGLSATLGDMRLAAQQLRPADPDHVALVESSEGGQDLQLAIRGYLEVPPPPASRPAASTHGRGGAQADAGGSGSAEELDDDDAETSRATPERQIAEHLFAVLRGNDNLVFANSRTNVEKYADRLRVLCERTNLPNEFFPHHGSLSKDLREDVEAALKDPSKPTTAVATTTLEMGIDIGSVTSIAQVGAPFSVASLRQRLGRSGRRGEPAVLRAYLIEPQTDARTPLDDQLRGGLVQTTVMLELLLQGWCEPPDPAVLHSSTLIQQILSLIAQHGGARAEQAHRALCGPDGPFQGTDPSRFTALLRALAAADVIEQDPDGALLLGEVGERVVNHYSFYTAFQTPEEYRLLSNGRQLGTLPVDFPLYSGLLLVFGGKRWQVIRVDDRQRTVDLVRAKGGRPPAFAGGGPDIHNHVRARMRTFLGGTDVPAYLNPSARRMLEEARSVFARENLGQVGVLDRGSSTILVPWVGSKAAHTLAIQLRAAGIEVVVDGLTLTCEKNTTLEVVEALSDLCASGPADPVALAVGVQAKEGNKYDAWLSEALLNQDYAARAFDTSAAHTAAERLLHEVQLMPEEAANTVPSDEPVDVDRLA